MEFIYEHDNFFPDVYCDHLVEKYETDGIKTKGRTAAGVDINIKRSLDVVMGRDNETWFDEICYIYVKVKQGLQKYVKYLSDNDYHNQKQLYEMIKTSTLTHPQIQKTEPNGFYTWHFDGGVPVCHRLFTYIIYLNDLNIDAGGSTEFLHKKIQPKKGKLVIFPATWPLLHRGETVRKGNKYILTGFVLSSPE